jgi:hypothetical protein
LDPQRLLRLLAARLQIATSRSFRGKRARYASASSLRGSTDGRELRESFLAIGHEAKRDLLQRLHPGHDASMRGDRQGSSM